MMMKVVAVMVVVVMVVVMLVIVMLPGQIQYDLLDNLASRTMHPVTAQK
jgi:hypothetical protein